jgi:hypothetical protein
VGSVGDVIGNAGVAQVGTVSRMLLPTDGLWHGAMYAFQDSSLLRVAGFDGASPFFGTAPLSGAYLVWVIVWVGLIGGLAALAFSRRDV